MAVVVGAFYLVKNKFKADKWDLAVCKTVKEEGVSCFGNGYILKGYQTQAECMEKGLELAKKEGFDCGKNCREEYGVLVCDIVCNKNGCRD